MKTALAFLCFILCGVAAWAYIPSTHFIFDRLASSHGKGSYIIDTEVVFREGADSYTVRENWIVHDDGSIRLFAQGPEGFRAFRVKKSNRVFWVDSNRAEHADEATSDYFMFPLISRSSLDLKRFFVRWNILPTDILGPRKSKDIKDVKDIKELAPEKEDFVRLGRVSGAVTYAYGTPTPPNSKPQAGLWIEQDAFLVRMMRSPTGAELAANDYAPYSKNLWFPRQQTITFDNKSVAIRTVRVQSTELSRDQKAQLETSYLKSKPDVAATNWPRHALVSQVQEFYKRFR